MNTYIHRLLILLFVLPTAAAAQISVRSSLSDDREVAPGSVYAGVIDIWNETGEVQEAKIYQTDYRFFADGSNQYGEPGNDDRSNAGWVQVSNSALLIPPFDHVPVSYRVSVPDTLNNEAVSGSYWSMIMVEAVPKESPESTINPATGEPQYAVLQITRYGIQVASHIAGTGERTLAMPEGKLVQMENGGLSFQVNVENNGSRMARPEVWVELYGEDGTALGRRNGVQNRIYPGTSVRQDIELGNLEPGEYRALVILDAGVDDVFGAEYRLRVE